MNSCAKLILTASIPLLLISCFRQDVRTISVNVPQMKTADCSKLIQDALTHADGLVSAVPNLETKQISITYDAKKLAIKNIEFIIAGAGFDANDTSAPAEAKTALPADCR